MHRTGGDTKRSLWYHACSLGPLDRGDDVTSVIQTTEDTRDVHTLGLLHLIHQLADVVGNRIHAQGIKTTVQHVGLDAYLIEGLTEGTNGQIRILASHEVDLFESATIGFYTGETSHINDDGRNAL